MDYTLSDSYDTHAGTGNRMHNQAKSVPTQISDKDLNQAIWSLMELVKSVGLTGLQFDPDVPASYTRVASAIQMLMQRQTPCVAAAGGTADAITATFIPAISALTPGMTVLVRSVAANATATPTFTPAPGVVAPWQIVKGAGQDLVPGDIPDAGYWMELLCDPVSGRWVLKNPATGFSNVIQQTWQNLTASRAFLSTYTNVSDQPISLMIEYSSTSGSSSLIIDVSGDLIAIQTTAPVSGAQSVGSISIPAGATYSASVSHGAASLISWWELA